MGRLTIEIVSTVNTVAAASAENEGQESKIIKEPNQPGLKKKTELTGGKFATVAMMGYAKRAAIRNVMKGASFEISGISKQTGNSALQDKVAREHELKMDNVGVAKSAGAGALLGLKFGPKGAVIGGIIGLGVGFASRQVERENRYNERRRAYEFAGFKFDSARSINLERAGVTLHSGRLHQF